MNTHNLYLAMFSPSTIQIVPFDSEHGADTARQYAGKYASKPEKWYTTILCASLLLSCADMRPHVVPYPGGCHCGSSAVLCQSVFQA